MDKDRDGFTSVAELKTVVEESYRKLIEGLQVVAVMLERSRIADDDLH